MESLQFTTLKRILSSLSDRREIAELKQLLEQRTEVVFIERAKELLDRDGYVVTKEEIPELPAELSLMMVSFTFPLEVKNREVRQTGPPLVMGKEIKFQLCTELIDDIQHDFNVTELQPDRELTCKLEFNLYWKPQQVPLFSPSRECSTPVPGKYWCLTPIDFEPVVLKLPLGNNKGFEGVFVLQRAE